MDFGENPILQGEELSDERHRQTDPPQDFIQGFIFTKNVNFHLTRKVNPAADTAVKKL